MYKRLKYYFPAKTQEKQQMPKIKSIRKSYKNYNTKLIKI